MVDFPGASRPKGWFGRWIDDTVWRYVLLFAWHLRRYPPPYRPGVVQIPPPEAKSGDLFALMTDLEPSRHRPLRLRLLHVLLDYLRRRGDPRLRRRGRIRDDAEMMDVLGLSQECSRHVSS